MAMAQNAVRKLRSIRFPYVLKYLDTAESHGIIYLAVERVTPFVQVLDSWRDGKRDAASSAWTAWGISHIASAIAFLHTQARAIHGNIQASSVFLSPAGEWLLGGFETLTSVNDVQFLAQYGGQPPNSYKFAAPEVEAGWGRISELPIHSIDSYALGLLAIEAFNDQVPMNMRTISVGRIPALLYPLLKQMTHHDPFSRLSAADLVTEGNKSGGFLANNELVQASSLIEEFRLAEIYRKEAILSELEGLQPHLLPTFSQFKVLPVLVEAFRSKPNPNGLNDGLELSTRVLLPLMLRLGEHLEDARWKLALGSTVLEAFGTTYSPMRATLLTHLNLYVEHLDTRSVSSRIWPSLAAWFEDPYEIVRSAVLESIPLLIPKLSERTLNNELLRQLAKTQVDLQPALRIQTTKLLGKLTPHLTLATRANVLVPAFSRSLKDNYEQARLAGVEAFGSNQESFDAESSARNVIPALSPCLVDKNREVREATLVTLQAYLDKIQKHTASLSTVSTELPAAPVMASTRSEASTAAESRSAFSFLSATAGSAASALSDWAISQLDADEAESTSGASAPASVAPTPAFSSPKEVSAASSPTRSSFTPPSASTENMEKASSGMDLGKKAVKSNSLSQAFQSQPQKAPKAAIQPNFGGPTANMSKPAVVRPPPMRTAVSAPARPAAPIIRPSSSIRPAPVAAAKTELPASPTSTPSPAPAPAIRAAPSSTAPTKTPSAAMAAKMAELQRLREERRAVRPLLTQRKTQN